MNDNRESLEEFVKNESESAFRELVTRYIDLVHSTAVRLVDGDAHRAEDVTQIVFTDLARTARKLSKETMLGGWLHRHTCFVARTLMRSERRRQARERQALDMNDSKANMDDGLAQLAPVLDEAINQLGNADRTAIVLRFFEQRDLRAVGEALGSSENAAQKRVGRALEQLRVFLQRRGITLSAGALGTVLATKAVTAAPTGMALSIAGTALVNAAAGGGTLLTFLKMIAMTKFKLGAISALVVAGASTAIFLQSHALAKLREENRALRDQAAQTTPQLPDGQRLTENLTVQEPPLAEDRLRELLRLRGEVSGLKRQLAEAAKSRPKTTQITAAEPQEESMDDQKRMGIARLNYTKGWMMAFFNYSQQYEGRFPTNFEQAASFLPNEAKDQTNLAPDQFEIVYQGSLNELATPQNYFIIREKEAWPSPNGGWNRTYAFADGHSEIHHSDDGNFSPWEDWHRPNASEQ